EWVVQRALDEDARSAQTDLALIPKARANRRGDAFVEIGVGENDVRIFSSELERDFLEQRRRVRRDRRAVDGAPGERDQRNVGMQCEGATRFLSVAVNDVDDTR